VVVVAHSYENTLSPETAGVQLASCEENAMVRTMKTTHGIFAALLVCVFASCHYEFAAAPKSDLPADGAFRGKWQKQDGNEHTTISVATTPDGYYFAHCRGDKDDGLIYRAYPLAKDLPGLLQVELLNSSIKDDFPKERFTIAKVAVENDKLTWRVIDPDKAGPVKDGAALLDVLRKAEAEKKDIFGQPQTFDHVKEH
jgi:hypothetical protein